MQVSLRQVRVSKQSCKVPTRMSVLNVSCYAEYGFVAEDRLPFAAAEAAAEAVAAAENSTVISGSLNSTVSNDHNASAFSPPPESEPPSPSETAPLNVLRAVHQGLLYHDAERLGTRTHLGLYTWCAARLPLVFLNVMRGVAFSRRVF